MLLFDSEREIAFKNIFDLFMMSKDNADKLPLKYTWVLWFHRFEDGKWDVKSYRQIFDFDNVTDFWRMQNNMPSVFSGMFFLMKKGILPLYEDPQNIEGGIWSFRVQKRNIAEVWNDVLIHLVAGVLHPDLDDINGVSVNPRSAVLKLWTMTHDESVKDCPVTTKIRHLLPEKALFLKTKNGT